jgi:hypothetical protein
MSARLAQLEIFSSVVVASLDFCCFIPITSPCRDFFRVYACKITSVEPVSLFSESALVNDSQDECVFVSGAEQVRHFLPPWAFGAECFETVTTSEDNLACLYKITHLRSVFVRSMMHQHCVVVHERFSIKLMLSLCAVPQGFRLYVMRRWGWLMT